jgi:hypothetical protein
MDACFSETGSILGRKAVQQDATTDAFQWDCICHRYSAQQAKESINTLAGSFPIQGRAPFPDESSQANMCAVPQLQAGGVHIHEEQQTTSLI